MITRTCPVCGKEFATADSRKLYCSRVCMHRAGTRRWWAKHHPHGASETRTCPICGEEFETNPSRKVHKYCSKTCARRAGARRQTARKTAARKAARRPRLCPVCGTEFTPQHHRQRYCSPKCRLLIKRGRILALRARRRIEARKPKVCPGCGEEFMPAHGRQKYCSRACLARMANRKWREKRRPQQGSRTCPTCGKEFAVDPKHRATRFCSRSCANQAIAAAVRLPPRACAWCGKKFKPRAWASRYCSPECQYGARRHRERSVASAASPAAVDEAKIRAYLALPPAERWARHKELNAAEHKIAQRMYAEDHASRCVAVNW